MSLVPNTSPHLLNKKIGSKYYMFVSFIKYVPFKLIRYLFINQIYIYIYFLSFFFISISINTYTNKNKKYNNNNNNNNKITIHYNKLQYIVLQSCYGESNVEYNLLVEYRYS